MIIQKYKVDINNMKSEVGSLKSHNEEHHTLNKRYQNENEQLTTLLLHKQKKAKT